jgi:hypothetical protein
MLSLGTVILPNANTGNLAVVGLAIVAALDLDTRTALELPGGAVLLAPRLAPPA